MHTFEFYSNVFHSTIMVIRVSTNSGASGHNKKKFKVENRGRGKLKREKESPSAVVMTPVIVIVVIRFGSIIGKEYTATVAHPSRTFTRSHSICHMHNSFVEGGGRGLNLLLNPIPIYYASVFPLPSRHWSIYLSHWTFQSAIFLFQYFSCSLHARLLVVVG